MEIVNDLDQAVQAMRALGDSTRLSIFRRLVEAGPDGMVVGQIADGLAEAQTVAPATLSFHLKVLSHAGLIRSAKERQFIRYFADFDAINGLIGYLTAHCCGGRPERCVSFHPIAPKRKGSPACP